ncbi:MAG: anti-sigma factor antagonist [Lachnospiraceae bacterium]|nr:anti-sigma factor antagonist [Lachnospiraceae bacterium]
MKRFDIEEKREDGMPVLAFKGRLDASAYDTAKERLDGIAEDERLILDFGELSYISSSGLRLLVTRQKKQKDMRIIGVNPIVMEIFHVTGMTGVLKTEPAFEEVSVEGLPVLGMGASCEVYRMDDERVLKLYLAEIPLALIRQEKEYAQTAFLSGVRTAVSYQIVTCGGRYGTIFELMHAKTLAELMDNDPDQLPAYAAQAGQLLSEIHHTSFQEGALPRISAHYHDMADRMGDYLTPEEIARLHRFIDSIPERDTFVHGDFHPKNIMNSDEGLMLIDMADASMGNPVFDLGASYMSFVQIPKTMGEGAREMMGLDPALLPGAWEVILDTYFKDRTKEVRAKAAVMAGILSSLKRTLIVPNLTMFPAALREQIIAGAREEFFPVMEGFAEEFKELL